MVLVGGVASAGRRGEVKRSGIPSRRTLVEIMTPGEYIEVHVGVVPAWCYRGACFELVRAISGGDLHECLLQTVLQ